MADIVRRPLAEQDLIEIWLYTFEAWGEEQADLYLAKLEEGMVVLTKHPLLCQLHITFNPPVRIYHCQHHLIIYNETQLGIEVIRVLHESMNIEGQLD